MLIVKSAFLLCLLSSVTASWTESGGCRNDHARHLDTCALHGVPNLLCVFRFAVKENEFLIGEAKRLQIRGRRDGLRGKVGRRRRRRSWSRVVFRRRKEIGLGQSLDGGVAVHAAVVLVVEVLSRLFDLRLGLRRRELSRSGQEPGRVLEVGRGLLRIGLA